MLHSPATSSTPSHRRPLALLVSFAMLAQLLVLALAALTPGTARADGPGGPFPVNMNTVSELPERGGWGVADKDPDAAHNFENLVWDFAQIGDRMFVAGSFLHVQDPETGAQYDQPYLAAFDADTGAWIPEFAPNLDAAVFALEVSPAGFLIAGGQFTSLDGQQYTEALVGIDPVDGSAATGFQASVERPFSSEAALVRSLEVIGDDLYVGGNFNYIRGLNGDRPQMWNLGRVDANFGNPDSSWTPVVEGGGVWAFGIDPTRDRIHFGGINIDTVNGVPTPRLGTVYLSSDALVPGQTDYEFNYTFSQQDIWDVEATDGNVWVAGEQHMLSILNPDTRTREAYHHTGLKAEAFTPYPGSFAGGSFQLAEEIGDWIIAGCHCTYEWRSNNGFTGNSWYDSVADVRRPIKLAGAIDKNTGAAIDWSPDLASSTQGAWSAHSDTNGCLWLGGDFGLAGLEAGATFWVGGFARFCSPGTPNATMTCIATSLANGDVVVSWSDLGVNGYDVSHDGGQPIWETDFSYVDTTPGTTYTVTAWGQGQTDDCVVDEHLGGGGAGSFVCTVTNNIGSVTVSWTDVGASGHDVTEDGGSPSWKTGTSFIDVTPGTDYTVTAWGGPASGSTTSCTNPNPGGGGWDCTVTNNPNGSVTIAWPDIGANGYDLSQDGQTSQWITTTSFTDFTPGTDYTLTAWGGGVGGTTTSCTNPNPGGGGWDCSISTNIDGSVTISWPDIGANGYDVAHDGGPAQWVNGTVWVDTTPGTNYSVTAWGGGVGGTTTACAI